METKYLFQYKSHNVSEFKRIQFILKSSHLILKIIYDMFNLNIMLIRSLINTFILEIAVLLVNIPNRYSKPLID